MSTPFKWSFWFFLILFLVFIITYTSILQHAAVRTTSEIEALAENLSVGLIRSELEESDDGYVYFDKEEVISNLTTNVANVQKNHRYNIDLQYVFLDRSGNVTENESDMRGLQLIVQFKNNKDEIKATAERHLTINTLNE